MVFSHRGAGANVVGIVWFLNITSGIASEVSRSTLVACYLSGDALASRELGNVFRVRRVVEVAVEPPL